ncbi:DNA methyltransferase family protein [Polaromonas glacialis]|uniref:adenine methyltransferase n=1 Tax=Polaromonas glacialis TaxID=866564 RepID=UPI000A493ED2|nr:adenine methyltransferase [Polaromonas glacialis]
MSLAKPLVENSGTSFEGTKKYGDFDISGELARSWLLQPNPHGRPNSEVVKPWRNGQGLAKRPTDTWIIDFGSEASEFEAVLFEAPFTHLQRVVKPERMKANLTEKWWLHERPRGAMRIAMLPLSRYVATVRVSKHRYFCFLDSTILPDTRLNVFARLDDGSFGILSSRIHEVWSLAQASMHGVGNDPTYNAKSCFETFPFPAGLTPADTAHQKTEAIEGGALIPADISAPKKALTQKARAQAAIKSIAIREHAMHIARAAKRLNDLRENWLNPPEWTQRLPEVIPLGMDASPYPDRIVPRNGHEKELAERTLTKLYNQRPAWLDAAHQALDDAVAAAYGWLDYRADLPDEEILKRLLALNLQRAKVQGATK